MATRILSTAPSYMDFRPGFIPPSAGDLEEGRIRREMDLAKLKNLQLEPEHQRRLLALQEAGLRETTSYHSGQLASDTRTQNINMRGQDVQMRGQDMASQEHKDALRSSTINNILAHAISRPDVPLSVYAETAKQFGFPEVANSFATAHDNEQTTKAKQLGSALVAAKADPKTYTDLLSTYKAMPDFNELAPKIKASVPKEYAVDLDPTKPGVQTTAGDYNDPEIAAALIQQREQDRVLNEKKARDKVENIRYSAQRAFGIKKVPIIPGYLH